MPKKKRNKELNGNAVQYLNEDVSNHVLYPVVDSTPATASSIAITSTFVLGLVLCATLLDWSSISVHIDRSLGTALQKTATHDLIISQPQRTIYDYYKSGGSMDAEKRRDAMGYFVDPLDKSGLSIEAWSEVGENTDLLDYLEQQEEAAGQGNEEEALNTLRAAMHYRTAGRSMKAQRLFEHALALAPRHADVLAEYGYYQETVTGDVLKAESLYTRALIQCPSHQIATERRRLTQPLVEEIDQQMLNAIDRKRAYFLQIPRHNPSLRRAMRDAYFAHVYHTVAIEGNSLNYLQTRSILETKLAVAGKSVVEHNEILGMDAALRYLNHSLVHRVGDLHLSDLLDIHERVLGYVDPTQAGRFRQTQVYVGGFTPVDPTQVSQEMNYFVDWLNDPTTLELHPVELAAIAHYKFVYIHPFIDGNGRTGRLLMNLLLMAAGFPPVIIRVEDRLEYYEALRDANDGDLRPFIRMIARATQRTLQMYIDVVTVQSHAANVANTHSPSTATELPLL